MPPPESCRRRGRWISFERISSPSLSQCTAESSDVGAGAGAEGSSGAGDGMLGEAPMHVSGSAGEECLGDVK